MKVNVVGFGAVSGYGWGVDALVRGLATGHSAVANHPEAIPGHSGRMDMARVPVQPIKDGDAPQCRYTAAVHAVVGEAVSEARSHGWRPGAKVGMVLATARGDVECMEAQYASAHKESDRRRYVRALPSTPIVEVMRAHGFSGPTMTVGAACAAGLTALHSARALVHMQSATDVIVVGVDIGTSPETVLPLAALGTLRLDSSDGSAFRPFAASARGFHLGEGAAALIVTGRSHAREVRILATGIANDHHHATSINPDDGVLMDTIDDTLRMAAVDPSLALGYLAHGSGTPQCRRAEESVIRHIPGTRRVLALKPLLGHCRAAGSLLELTALARAGLERIPSSAFPAGRPVGNEDGIRTWLQISLGFGGNIAAGLMQLPPHASSAVMPE